MKSNCRLQNKTNHNRLTSKPDSSPTDTNLEALIKHHCVFTRSLTILTLLLGLVRGDTRSLEDTKIGIYDNNLRYHCNHIKMDLSQDPWLQSPGGATAASPFVGKNVGGLPCL